MPTLTSRARSGFSLVELIVAMVLFSIIGVSLYKVLMNNQRSYDTQVQTVDMQQNLRDAAVILPSELRELDAADGDIIAMSDNSLTVRGMRQVALACSPPVLGGAVNARTFTVRPLRSSVAAFAVNDSVLFYYEGNWNVKTDDGWLLGKITVLNGVTNCPDGKPGIGLTADLVPIAAPYTNTAGFIPTNAPVRGFQPVTYSQYLAADGKYYLAMSINNGTTYPVVGPLDGSTGLVFSYLTANGTATTDRLAVRQIGIALRLQTAKNIQTGGVAGPAKDSLNLVVALRNNPRY
jgi:prepilin-type N-terminal cleavage/methylation domain-containing protein